MPKKQILEKYLNTVYFGNGAYGVQAAAETYFDENVEDLTVAQGAFLAGMVRNPVGYDPLRYPVAARARRNQAVDRMLSERDLTPEAAAAIKTIPLPDKVSHPLPEVNDFFVEAVKQRLLSDTRLGETAQERYNAVFNGGLDIYTTLDPKLEALAKEKVQQILPDTNGKFDAAVASIDPATGAVRALVGGQNFGAVEGRPRARRRRRRHRTSARFVVQGVRADGRARAGVRARRRGGRHRAVHHQDPRLRAVDRPTTTRAKAVA